MVHRAWFITLSALITIPLLWACGNASSSLLAQPSAQLLTCADIDANWGKDWPTVLNALDQLIQSNVDCGKAPLQQKKFAAHFNYGTSLEGQGKRDEAIQQYHLALSTEPQRREALNALARLGALPKPTPPNCLSDSAPQPDPASALQANPARFVKVVGNTFQLNGRPFNIKGVNYYPRHAPWDRFFTEANLADITQEFDVIQASGLNTLRIFLTYEPLFTCHPEEAIPNEAVFAFIDQLFALATQRNLKLIITLNDVPDLTFRPLYTDWGHYDAQTVYIVQRYRNEASLLAWDVRNEPDLDLEQNPEQFSETDVVAWLDHITTLIRQHDPNHLITTAWLKDPSPSLPYVDFVSFAHWDTSEELAQRLISYQGQFNKPLLLINAGVHSWSGDVDNPQDEKSQAEYLSQITGLAEDNNVGWMLWTAFDFAPTPGQLDNKNLHFGLWRSDLQPKLVLDDLPIGP